MDTATLAYRPADTSIALLDQTVGYALRAAASEAPDRVAIVEGTPGPGPRRRMTYGQLLGDAEQVARALLTRFPVLRFEAVELFERRDKFHATEKRMGNKRTLLCELLLPDGPLTVALVHLDPFAGPRNRARQLAQVVERMHLPYPILSDADLALTRALDLPTFDVDGMTLIKRVTLIVRDGAASGSGAASSGCGGAPRGPTVKNQIARPTGSRASRSAIALASLRHLPM